MTHIKKELLTYLLTLFVAFANAQNEQIDVPESVSKFLAEADSMIFVHVLSTCEIASVAERLSNDFIFLQTEGNNAYKTKIPRAQFLTNSAGFCKRINTSDTKIVRMIVPGSLQAHYLDRTTVIQTGKQKFFTVDTRGVMIIKEVSDFINVWRKDEGNWKLSRQMINQQEMLVTPPSSMMYDTIIRQDSILFSALNSRDLVTLKSMYSSDLEFYHDKQGRMNYEQIMQINKENFANNLSTTRRELDKDALQVFSPTKDCIIQVGKHRFFTKSGRNPEQLTTSPYFIHIWEKRNGHWNVTRAISYGH
jgi:hypothetical protein